MKRQRSRPQKFARVPEEMRQLAALLEKEALRWSE
jgi:hypothetical protein